MAVTLDQFVAYLGDSGLMPSDEARQLISGSPPDKRPQDAETFARALVRQNKLTGYQAGVLLQARTKGLVLGNYVILDKIGQGGMGMVFKARHERMDRLVALKVLPRSRIQSPNSVRRFQQEVKAAAKLAHPNIVTAYDADEADGVHFLVMEYVEGRDLLSLVREHGPLAIGDAVGYVSQAARGLDYAHRKGVVHRDIKPSNLLVDADGTVKILDMGLARFHEDASSKLDPVPQAATAAPGVTQVGVVVGTLEFMSPEQADDARRVDHRADIYSLGCTLYYLLTGSVPFSGQTVLQKVMAHRDNPIPSIRNARADAPDALDRVVRRMLAKSPAERYQRMSEVIEALEACVAGVAGHTRQGRRAIVGANPTDAARSETLAGVAMTVGGAERPESGEAVTLPWSRRRLLVGGAVGVVVAAMLIALLAVLFRPREPDQVAERTATGIAPSTAQPAEPVGDTSIVAYPPGSRSQDIAGETDVEPPAPADGTPPPDTNEMPAEPAAADADGNPSVPRAVKTGDSPDSPPPGPASDAERQSLAAAGRVPAVAEGSRSGDDDRRPDSTYAPARAESAAPAPAAFEVQIRELLEKGWTVRLSARQVAEEHFKTAKAICPDDPRADYALGLVLLKHQQYDKSLDRFEASGRQAGKPYLPGLRAAIWLRVLRKAYEPAIVELPALTRAWQESEPESMPDWVKEDCVKWTGRLMGFLEGPVNNRSVDQLCEECDAELRRLLAPPHQELYQQAKNDVLERYAAKSGAQEKARVEAKKQQEKEQEDTKARLAQVDEDRKMTQAKADELEKDLKRRLAEIDARIAGLSREYDRLDLRARTVQASIERIDQDIASLTALRNQAMAGSRSTPSVDSKSSGSSKSKAPSQTTVDRDLQYAATLQVSIDQKNRERANYQAEFDRLEVLARDAERQASGLLGQRQAAISEYQTATGRLYKESKDLMKKESVLRGKQKGKSATGNTAQVQRLGQEATSLRTYVDLSLEAERQKLLGSFGTP